MPFRLDFFFCCRYFTFNTLDLQWIGTNFCLYLRNDERQHIAPKRWKLFVDFSVGLLTNAFVCDICRQNLTNLHLCKIASEDFFFKTAKFFSIRLIKVAPWIFSLDSMKKKIIENLIRHGHPWKIFKSHRKFPV